MFWRTVKNENDKLILEYELDTLTKGFFNKQFLLDYIQNLVLLEDNGKDIIKKIAGNNQFDAFRTAVDTVI